MLAIQADDDGIPRVVELSTGRSVPVDAARWKEILAMVGLRGQNIVPVIPPHTADDIPKIKASFSDVMDSFGQPLMSDEIPESA